MQLQRPSLFTYNKASSHLVFLNDCIYCHAAFSLSARALSQCHPWPLTSSVQQ